MNRASDTRGSPSTIAILFRPIDHRLDPTRSVVRWNEPRPVHHRGPRCGRRQIGVDVIDSTAEAGCERRGARHGEPRAGKAEPRLKEVRRVPDGELYAR